MFSSTLKKGNIFHEFMLASMDEIAFPKGGYSLQERTKGGETENGTELPP